MQKTQEGLSSRSNEFDGVLISHAQLHECNGHQHGGPAEARHTVHCNGAAGTLFVAAPQQLQPFLHDLNCNNIWEK